MQTLAGVSWRSLARRKSRYVLTALGTGLGVAALFGMLVSTTAVRDTLDRDLRVGIGEADVIVSQTGTFDAGIPADLEPRVAALPDVEVAVGGVGIRTRIVGDGEADPRVGAGQDEGITFLSGLDHARASAIRPYELIEGAWCGDGADEVVLDDAVADVEDLAVGDVVRVAVPTGVAPLTVVGIRSRTGTGGFDEGLYTSVATAQRLLGRPGVLHGIDVVLADGVDVGDWIFANRDALGPGLAFQRAANIGSEFKQFVDGVNGALTTVSVIAVFVGGFLVFLTFSVSVTERTRVWGTLRAVGGVPGQVRRLVVGEGLLLSLVAAGPGLLVGYGLARIITGIAGGLLGIDVPSVGFPIGTAAASVAVALVVTAVASWLPARRAARIPPVAAMRELVDTGQRPARPWLGLALVAGGLVVSTQTTSTALRSSGSFLVLAGGVALAPAVTGPAAGVLGRVTSRLAPALGRISVAHLRRERSRSAYTLGLIMVVMAMLVAIASGNLAMARSIDRVIERQGGDAVQVFAPGSFDPEVEAIVRSVPEVEATSPIRFGEVEIPIDGGDRRRQFLTVIDPATYFEVASFAWESGSDESMRAALSAGGAVALPEALAFELDVEAGDTITVTTTTGPADFTVAGTYALIGGGFGLVAGTPDLARFGAGRPQGYLVGIADGADPEEVAAAIDTAVGPERDVIIETATTTKAWAHEQLRGFFGLAYAMLAFAAVIGTLGLANTLIVSVIARTREIGILRSSGAVPRQVRRMVLVEAATLVAVALVLALPLGGILGIGLVDTQRDALGFSIDFRYPWPVIVPMLVGAGLLGAAASFWPARRAARLDPVVALRFD